MALARKRGQSRHKFAPVSRPTHAPAKLKRGGLFGCPYSNLKKFCIAVHRHTNSKDTGRKNEIRLAFSFVERKNAARDLGEQASAAVY